MKKFENFIVNAGTTAIFIGLVALLILGIISLYKLTFLPNTPKAEYIEVVNVERTESGELITLDIEGELHNYYYYCEY